MTQITLSRDRMHAPHNKSDLETLRRASIGSWPGRNNRVRRRSENHSKANRSHHPTKQSDRQRRSLSQSDCEKFNYELTPIVLSKHHRDQLQSDDSEQNSIDPLFDPWLNSDPGSPPRTCGTPYGQCNAWNPVNLALQEKNWYRQ